MPHPWATVVGGRGEFISGILDLICEHPEESPSMSSLRESFPGGWISEEPKTRRKKVMQLKKERKWAPARRPERALIMRGKWWTLGFANVRCSTTCVAGGLWIKVSSDFKIAARGFWTGCDVIRKRYPTLAKDIFFWKLRSLTTAWNNAWSHRATSNTPPARILNIYRVEGLKDGSPNVSRVSKYMENKLFLRKKCASKLWL